MADLIPAGGVAGGCAGLHVVLNGAPIGLSSITALKHQLYHTQILSAIPTADLEKTLCTTVAITSDGAMADSFSISVLEILSLAEVVYKQSREFWRECKHCPEEIKALVMVINSLKGALEGLQLLIEDATWEDFGMISSRLFSHGRIRPQGCAETIDFAILC